MPHFVDWAAEVKKVVKIPVGVINRIHDPLLGEQILEQKKADLIWMTRPLMADPELPKKVAEGREDEIRTCVSCNYCMDSEWLDFSMMPGCLVNPDCFREGKFRIEPTRRPKRVLVIGGGPSGMEAARVARLIGHDVTLWEKDNKLGGQVNLAAIPPGKEVLGANPVLFHPVEEA